MNKMVLALVAVLILLVFSHPMPATTPTPTATPAPVLSWSQPPAYNAQSPYPSCFWGWGEYTEYGGFQIAADDWHCVTDATITGIDWWGSYVDWNNQTPPADAPVTFTIGMWDDVPAGVDAPFNHPGSLLWQMTVDRSGLNEHVDGCNYFTGATGVSPSFKYELAIPEQERFSSGPGIYWVSIVANYTSGSGSHPWGWGTREHVFNGAGLRIYESTTDPYYIAGEPIQDHVAGDLWDLAFELMAFSDPTPTPTMAPTLLPTEIPTTTPTLTATATPTPTVTPVPGLKWSQPPAYSTQSSYPDCFWGWGEQTEYGGNQIAAADWHCEDDYTVSEIHWWGSYADWNAQAPPTEAPVAFDVGIWDDVPAGIYEPFNHPGNLLWQMTVDRGDLNEHVAGCDYFEGSMTGISTSFKYEFSIAEPNRFLAVPGIYWISIAAHYGSSPGPHSWGWETREHVFNGAALRIYESTTGSGYIMGEPIQDQIFGDFWDMAFELHSPIEPTPTPTATPTATNTATPTALPTNTPTHSPTATPTETPLPTTTPVPTLTATPTPVVPSYLDLTVLLHGLYNAIDTESSRGISGDYGLTIELRDTIDGSGSNYRYYGVALDKYGAVDGGPLDLGIIEPGEYYLAVSQLNHLAVMVDGMLTIDHGSTLFVNLSDPVSGDYLPVTGTGTMYEESNGIFSLHAGNGNADPGQERYINVLDAMVWINANGSSPGSPNWDIHADFDANDMINVLDVLLWIHCNGVMGEVTIEPLAVAITSPLDGTATGSSTITVSGTVNDNNAAVDVNGVPATVSGGLFTAEEIPLMGGSNQVTATAQDQNGDSAEDQITVMVVY